jgi:hypothetical protein
MPVTLATLALSSVVANAGPALPPTRAELDPKRFRLRTGSLEIGVGWRPEYDIQHGVCGLNIACGVTPRIGFDLELGSRAVRLVVGSFTAPMPMFTGDLVTLDAFMIEIGVLFGGPNVRGGIVLDGGAINAGGAAILRLSPWVDRRGHRHGIDIRAGTTIFHLMDFAVSYRFYPRGLDRKKPR